MSDGEEVNVTALRLAMQDSLNEVALERHEYPRIPGMVRSLFIRG